MQNMVFCYLLNIYYLLAIRALDLKLMFFKKSLIRSVQALT